MLLLLDQVVVNFLRDVSQVSLVLGEKQLINLRAFKQDTSDFRSHIFINTLNVRVNVVTNLLLLSIDLLRGQFLHKRLIRTDEAREVGLHHGMQTLGLYTRGLATWALVLTTRLIVLVVAASAAALRVTATWVLLSLVWSRTPLTCISSGLLWWLRSHNFD